MHGAVKPPTLAQRLSQELPAALRSAGADYEAAHRATLHFLGTVALADVRTEPEAVAKRLDRELRDAGIQAYRAFHLAREAVAAAVRADRLAILDTLHAPPVVGAEFRRGFEHLREALESAVKAGKSLDALPTPEGEGEFGLGAQAFHAAVRRATGALP